MPKQIQRLRRAERACLTAISVCSRLGTMSGLGCTTPGIRKCSPLPGICLNIARSGVNLVESFVLLRHEDGHLDKTHYYEAPYIPGSDVRH